MGQSWPLFSLFRFFVQDTIKIQIDKSSDGVHGTRARATGWKAQRIH